MHRIRGNHGSEEATFKFPDEVDHRVIDVVGQTSTNYAGDEKNKTFSFTFDKVFTPATTQVEVFEEISQLVQSALDGYKVTVFAYGQTGSGKTFTMEGPENPTPDTIGVIPRAVAQIFQEACELRPRGWDFKLEATFIEIYLEEIRDLLAKKNGAKHEIHHGYVYYLGPFPCISIILPIDRYTVCFASVLGIHGRGGSRGVGVFLQPYTTMCHGSLRKRFTTSGVTRV